MCARRSRRVLGRRTQLTQEQLLDARLCLAGIIVHFVPRAQRRRAVNGQEVADHHDLVQDPPQPVHLVRVMVGGRK